MRPLTVAALLAGLLSAPVLAQPVGTTPAAGATEIPAGQLRAGNLMDRDVYATDNVEIGEVEDLIIDAQGQVTMVVIEVESRLGLTQKYVSVPMQRLRAVPGERRVTIDMPSAEIRSLPAVNYR
ncbi:PRC-barrel domain-containing protein [Pararoseomonas indoligenes]|uniref:PRC-barrel domain-containing protein n=1 Tax=Roseomonas indoligenes TaxID=2820811 RepID=A0A940S8L8_9PROT|nr:PRC-barrel domain-containing protein [Pararoseomonas indoligenes]MBP0494308.1 PRC-barrel domain-containing protein [Pararoseomonas indoligenes]